MVEVRRGVVFADFIVVLSVSLVAWPLVENTKSVEEGAKMVVVIGEVVDRARDGEVALDVGVDVDVRNDMVLDVGRDVVSGGVDVEMDVYVDMISKVDVAAYVDVDIAGEAVAVEVVVGADSVADEDMKVVGDVGVIMLESDVDGVPLVVVVVIVLNSFTESGRVVAPGNVDSVLETVVGDNINDGDEPDTVEDDSGHAGTIVADVDVEGDDSDDADTVVADGDVDSDDADAAVAVSAVADAANSGAAIADDVVADSDVVAVSNFAMVDVESNSVVENVILHISSYSFLIFFSRSSSSGLHRAHFVNMKFLLV
jgi:hypothetical protein